MNPIISVIVPVHNLDLYLSKCLDSILAQTFTNIEVVLINDGSTDKSGAICDEYAKKDERVKVIHKNYGGVSSARNAGINAARGEYVGFVDGDDHVDKNMYQKLYTLCIETKSDVSICNLGREIDGKIINEKEERYTKEMDNTEAMRQLFKGVLFRFSLCNKLFVRKCFDGIEFPEGRIHEDLSTTYKLFNKAERTIFTNYTGYIYVKRKNSILISKYYSKRLDAFIGWDEILSFMHQKYPQLANEVNASYVYSCIDHVYYILNQVEAVVDRNKYLECVQSSIRKYYKDIRNNSTLSLTYKYMITILNYNAKLFILANNMMKVKRRILLRRWKK